ncbi:MFS transporter [Metabacillus iocasae]|uniref:MFS family permease n=1 Tax=Priestia iocasae TaxID=2291674 RepID=A0ABS2QUI7_9BACI|nr:MFS transporter [Metabacillus iocasae]MBM7703070.1 MFS family permease [Metabacillus iocasae]
MVNKQSFRFLWIGQSLANAADVLYIVGIMAIIYAETGAAIYMALVPFFITTSRFLSGILAPLLLDRYSLKGLLAYSQLGKTILALSMVLFVSFFLGSYPLAVLFVMVIGIAFLDGWASPAQHALIPQLVERNQLLKANGFLATIFEIIQLVGWAASGVFVALIGGKWVLWLTFFLFVLSTVMMFLLSVPNDKRVNEKRSSRQAGMKEGWRIIWQTPSLRMISGVQFIEAIANVVWVAAIMYVYVEQVLQVGEQWWGYMNASFALGCMIAGTLSLKYSQLLTKHLKMVIVGGACIVSGATLLLSGISTPWLALILSLSYGIANVLKAVGQDTLVQMSVSDSKLSKVYAAQESVIFGTFGLATLLMGYITDIYGPRFSFLLAGLLLLLSAIWLLVSRARLTVNDDEVVTSSEEIILG